MVIPQEAYIYLKLPPSPQTSFTPSFFWLNFRIPGHFGPQHLHVSGGYEDRGISQ